MSYRFLVAGFALTAIVTSCAKSPTNPAGTTTVTAPGLASPANGELIANLAQPVTLTVNNGLITKSDATVSYTFEVATDIGFANIVASKDVPQGSGQTSARLDVLAAGRDYFWRARTKGDDTLGAFTAPLRFTIGPAVTLSAPVPVSPLTGGTTDQKARLTVTNVTRTGPAGALSYRFEISTSSTFTTISISGTVPEGNGTTSFTAATELPGESSFFWRAQAVDSSSSITSAFSAAQSFATITTIDLRTVNYQRFPNVSAWPETNRIISVEQDGGGEGPMCINHEKRGQLPPMLFPGDPTTTVEANQWYFARINGQWYGGAGEWLRPNQICKFGQRTNEIGPDGTWDGPMDTWAPKRGELVGYMISTPARAWPGSRTLDERSNVVVLPWKINGISTP